MNWDVDEPEPLMVIGGRRWVKYKCVKEKIRTVKLEPTFYCTNLDKCVGYSKRWEHSDEPKGWIPDLLFCSQGHHMCEHLVIQVTRTDVKPEIELSQLKKISITIFDRDMPYARRGEEDYNDQDLTWDEIAFLKKHGKPYPKYGELKVLMKKQRSCQFTDLIDYF